MNRRSFLLGLGAAAPAFIAAGHLMKIKSLVPSEEIMFIPPGKYHMAVDSSEVSDECVYMTFSIEEGKFKISDWIKA